jgi:undecaprenyl-phosphate 4-deoxy-4-formamido-L-arabinose transferase
VTLDADLQNPPEDIPRLVEAALEGNDVVGTVRVPREDSLFRRTASAITNLVVQRVTGVRMHDYGCMLRAYRRPVVDALLASRDRKTFIPILANRYARRTTEIEVGHAPRRSGTSKYGLFDLLRLQMDLLISLTSTPLRVVTLGGLLLAVAGFGLGIVLAVGRLVYGSAWAAGGVFTLFAVLFFLVGVQLLGLGLVGEYLGRIYDDSRARPHYVVHEVIGSDGGSVAAYPPTATELTVQVAGNGGGERS